MKTLSPRTDRTDLPVGAHPEPSEAEIQKVAYCLWQEKGCPAGNDLENWFEARELILHRAAANQLHSSGRPGAASRNKPPSARAAGAEPGAAPASLHFPPSAALPSGAGSASTHLDFRHSTTPFQPRTTS